MFNREDYISDSEWNRFLEFSKDLETPNVVINLKQIKYNFIKLRDSFPYAHIYYAMKSNPGEPVLKLLAELGSNFDIASRYELDKIMSLGVGGDRLSYGNTIKKAKDIKYSTKRAFACSLPTQRTTLRQSPRTLQEAAFMSAC